MRERQFIDKIRDRFGGHSPFLLQGIGDDCAVFTETDSTACWLVSTDLLVENVHFLFDCHDPALLGRKSIAVNISDVAAMGGKPLFCLLSLVLPPSLQEEWLENWWNGVQTILDQYGCLLIGGDTSQGDCLTISVMVVGRTQQGRVLYRSGAGIGEDIYVSGTLGASAAGLEMLKKNIVSAEYESLRMAHLDPEPQVEIGCALGESGVITAMQDISDGIATDLSHICQASGIGATIEADALPFPPGLQSFCRKNNLDARKLALFGGEDYQLLFTALPGNRKELEKVAAHLGRTFYRVGFTTKGDGKVFLRSGEDILDITYRGFEHSSSAEADEDE